MGGVDLADMLIALYRIDLKTRRWYLSIFAQIIDMCINNAWLLRRRGLQLKQIKSQDMSLKKFRIEIYNSLVSKNRSRGRPSNLASPSRVIKKPSAPRPAAEVHYDKFGHFPELTIRGRCKLCGKNQTFIQCVKCKLRLCLKQEKNCFLSFHLKKNLNSIF